MPSVPRAARARYAALVTSDVNAALAIETVEALDAATRAIAEVLDLETVLQLIVDRVRALVDARYAALGIVDARRRIERFITSGLTRRGARADRAAAAGPRAAGPDHPRGALGPDPGDLGAPGFVRLPAAPSAR